MNSSFNCNCNCECKNKVFRLKSVSSSPISCCRCCPPKPQPTCPPATKPNEPPDCELKRIDLNNDSPVDLANGWRIFFNNTLVLGSIASNPAYCSNFTSDFEFNTPTIEQLANPFLQLELFNRGICPMVVWALNNGVPTLVKLNPGDVFPIRKLPTPSLSCLAYTLCMDTTL